MQERRAEARMLCADLIEVVWTDESGALRTEMANLEDISATGACLQLENPIAHETHVRIRHGNAQLEGRVRYCVYRESGYFVGVRFDQGSRWSRTRYRPQHMLDPRRLMRPLGPGAHGL